MAQQRRQQRRHGGGGLRLVTVLLLLSLCLARADVAVAAPWAPLAGAASASESEHGVATALENALAQEEVSRGHSTAILHPARVQEEVSRGHSTASTAPAAAEEDEGDGAVVLDRVAMESTEDYDFPGANRRHVPHP